MPLSEHEQRLLEQMERALYAEDSKFVQTFRGSDARRRRRRQVGVAVVGFVVGMALLLVGVAVPGFLWVGPLGFLVMLGAAMYVLYSSRRTTTPLEVITGGQARPAPPEGGSRRRSRPARAPRGGGGLMARFEERWRKRGLGGDGY
jgi:hypothetical protein